MHPPEKTKPINQEALKGLSAWPISKAAHRDGFSGSPELEPHSLVLISF